MKFSDFSANNAKTSNLIIRCFQITAASYILFFVFETLCLMSCMLNNPNDSRVVADWSNIFFKGYREIKKKLCSNFFNIQELKIDDADFT